MSKFIIRDKQPFGEVHNQYEHKGTLPNMPGHSNANLGSTTANGDNGKTHVESFADKNPGAYEYACRGRDNPFEPVGKNFGVGNRGLTERYTNVL